MRGAAGRGDPRDGARRRPGFLAGLAPACLVAALIVTPAWGNPASSFAFEPDKFGLLTLLLGIGLGAFVAARAGSASIRSLLARLRRPAYLIPLSVLVLAAISTIFSLQPDWSWWGSPQRGGGLLSMLALLAAFWLAWAWLGQPAGRETLCAAIVFSSIPVLLVGVWQRAGWPLPAPWAGDGFAGRAFSTLGNPAFLSSYLLLALPLTLALLKREAGAWRARDRRAARTTVYLGFLAAGQALALFWTRSRAGWLGIAAAIAFGGLLYAVRRRKQWLAAASTLVVCVFLVGALSVIQLMSLDGTWNGTERSRLLDPTGSGRQRLELWAQTEDYLLSGRVPAFRWLFGFGPDSQGLVLPNQVAYRPTAGSADDAPASAFDRGHNLWVDVALVGGAVGLLALLVGLVAVAWAGLRWLGWLASWKRGARGLGAGLVVTLLAVSLPPTLARLAGGDGRPSPAGLGVAIAAGLCAGLFWLTLDRRAWEPAALRVDYPLVGAALVGLFAHWIELQFSFETSSAGLLTVVLLAALWRGADRAEPIAAHGVASAPLSRSGTLFALASGALLGVFLAVSELAGATPPAALLAALWLAGAAWIAAWDGPASLTWYPLLSLAPPLCVWLGVRLAGGAGAHPLAVTMLAWAVVAGCAGAMGVLLRHKAAAWRQTIRSAQSDRHSPGWAGLALGLTIALAGLCVAVRPAAGSILTLRGLQLAQEGRAQDALTQLDRSLAWGVLDSLTYDAIAQVRLLQARQAMDVDAKQGRLAAAADAMRAAWDASPYQAGFGRRLALIYQEWAGTMPDAAGRRARLDEAQAALELAVRRAPADALLRDDLADLKKTLRDGR